MSSLKQIKANGANAKQSTRPRTDAGKSGSRLNAWKHGLSAQEVTIVNEDPKHFEALRAELWGEYQPASGLESVLMDRLAGYAWRLRRVPRLEAHHLRAGRFDFTSGPLLSLLTRYEAAVLNGFNRTLEQLLVLQERRRLEEEKTKVLPPVPANDDAP